MEKNKKIDVIVVGAGPSGLAAAITIAKEGNKVLVIEKSSDFGVKNMFGGACYLNSIKELIPDLWQNLPYERVLTNYNYILLNEENSISVSYKNRKNKNAFCITRYALDSFLGEYAKKLGVYFATDTLALELIKENGYITGVKTEAEEIKAPLVILAEGFNSLLAIKAGLRKKTAPKNAVLGIKEVIRLENIEKRFNLKEKEGALYQFFGGLDLKSEDKKCSNPPFGMGFLYTFKNSITLGIGISMKSLIEDKVKPYEYLEKLKKNEFVSSLIEGGEVIEYSAHAIPEGGINEDIKFYDNGVILVGDCANLVDAIHFEGTNLAIKSGILAGQACNFAIKKKDFSKRTLKNYKKELFKSFVISDI
ncbi:MAG: NAD(P)/FAD-dependent oxidoreductase, partial [Candidatus Gastranaerophilales bacterium]|nr:NAD(P)/FAD-dependent oxidoreductase [Candidatus Gastranaerophilales bacterium]